MPPKSRQAQRDRAEASSLAVFLPAASAANAAPSTRNDLSPDVLRRAIERGDQAAIDRVIAPCTSCMRSIRGARHVLEGSSRPRAATPCSACGLCGQQARLTGSLLYLLRGRRVFYSPGGHREGAGPRRCTQPHALGGLTAPLCSRTAPPVCSRSSPSLCACRSPLLCACS